MVAKAAHPVNILNDTELYTSKRLKPGGSQCEASLGYILKQMKTNHPNRLK
jgi:hypothetical protein